MAELSRSVGNNMFTDTYRRFIEKQDEEAFGEALYEAKQQHEALKQRLKQMRDRHEQWRDQHERRESRSLLSRSMGDYVIKTMERRYAKGEFGGAANFAIEGYNKAMKQMLDEEMESDTDEEELFASDPLRTFQARAVTMKFDKLNTVCSLRTKKELLQFRKGASGCIGAEVLFECEEVQKEVVIPAGVKVLVLKHSKRNSKPGPDGSVVYVTEESHGGKRPDDTAKIENAMRETADPLPFAPGEWQGDP